LKSFNDKDPTDCGEMSELIFGMAALALSMVLGVATVYSIRLYLEI